MPRSPEPPAGSIPLRSGPCPAAGYPDRPRLPRLETPLWHPRGTSSLALPGAVRQNPGPGTGTPTPGTTCERTPSPKRPI
jgi:hypothetical protein